MNPVRIGIAATIAVAVALAAGGAEATMCVKKSGAVVVRDACKKKETPMSPAQFEGVQGFAGTPGAAGGQGAKGDKGDPGDFRVIDSTGKLVGIVDIGHSDSIGVVVPNVGVGVLFSDTEDPTGFWQGDAYLYHEAADCKGALLIEAKQYELIPYIGAFANSAYFPAGEASVRTIASREYVDDDCATSITPRGLCCENYATPVDLSVTGAVVVPLSTIGTPPFHVAH